MSILDRRTDEPALGTTMGSTYSSNETTEGLLLLDLIMGEW
jgi:hypothetical protein